MPPKVELYLFIYFYQVVFNVFFLLHYCAQIFSNIMALSETTGKSLVQINANFSSQGTVVLVLELVLKVLDVVVTVEVVDVVLLMDVVVLAVLEDLKDL